MIGKFEFNSVSKDFFSARYCSGIEDKTIDSCYKEIAHAIDRYEPGLEGKIYEYLSRGFFTFATPILNSRLNKERGLPISCFLNSVEDNMYSINDIWSEQVFLSSNGGGVATDWSKVRPVGSKIKNQGVGGGILPFLKIQDVISSGISQGLVRKGSCAAYLSVYHPEIMDFINMRKHRNEQISMDKTVKILHHGVTLDDKFLEAVAKGEEVKQTFTGNMVSARSIYEAILFARKETGEPYIINLSKVNDPKLNNNYPYDITTSNLCTEIFMRTDEDNTGVCCLGSLNLELWDEMQESGEFENIIKVLYKSLRCVLQHTVVTTHSDEKQSRVKAVKKIQREILKERNIGIGTMGLFSYFAKSGLSLKYDFEECRDINKRIFKSIKECVAGFNDKHKSLLCMAQAPTSSISIVMNQVSPCTEPFKSNYYKSANASSPFFVKNKYLHEILKKKHGEVKAQMLWIEILDNDGSVKGLDLKLTEREEAIFYTAMEQSQYNLLTLAGDRQPFIDQGQSVNLFIDDSCSKKEFSTIHNYALFNQGLKSLYYAHSSSPAKRTKMSPGSACGIMDSECTSCE